jgi:hypothetical protein
MEKVNLLREHLLSLLSQTEAHLDFDKAIENIRADLRGKRPLNAAHSPWEVLEHMRITQCDLLDSARKANHVSPEFPAGYWPVTQAPPNGKAWDESVNAFRADYKAMTDWIASKATDLLAPAANGQTMLRQALLLADHNAYHLGEMVLLRRLLRDWPSRSRQIF